MFVFYSDDLDLENGSLQEEDLHHCVHVLRQKLGDTIVVTNGKGLTVNGKITKITKSILFFDIVSSNFEAEDPIKNGIALSPPKSTDRLVWFVEKATEIGIKYIYLFECNRTERSRINEARLNKIAISAMKQSKQCYLPEIKYFDKFPNLLDKCTGFQSKMIAYCEEKQNLINNQLSTNNIVLIGPEGDFTNQEIIQAKNEGFVTISLGNTILRTETAGLYAATLMENFKIK